MIEAILENKPVESKPVVIKPVEQTEIRIEQQRMEYRSGWEACRAEMPLYRNNSRGWGSE